MVAESLSKAIDALDQMGDTPLARDLRAKAVAGVAVVKGWEVKRPTQQELAAMIASVEEIHRRIESVSGRENSGDSGNPRET